VPTVYPGVLAEYDVEYVAVSAPAWQAATLVRPAPRLSVLRFRLAAKPYTVPNVKTPAPRIIKIRFI
jgi:hypothetical protein